MSVRSILLGHAIDTVPVRHECRCQVGCRDPSCPHEKYETYWEVRYDVLHRVIELRARGDNRWRWFRTALERRAGSVVAPYVKVSDPRVMTEMLQVISLLLNGREPEQAPAWDIETVRTGAIGIEPLRPSDDDG